MIWTVEGDTVRVDGTCVVEATCGASTGYAADPAILVFGTL